MRLDALDEAAVALWLPALDQQERERAARFVFSRHRVQFIAAHALLRAALSRLAGARPAAWRFVADPNGKPSAYLGASAAELSFNLSHTEGMAGIAAIARRDYCLGFDVEPIGREVDLAIARRFFCRDEVEWLDALPEGQRRAGLIRLWTLKEAFIKAIGKGLAQDLASFCFDPCTARIRFTPGLLERPADWHFEQRALDGSFIAAMGLRRSAETPVDVRWSVVTPEELGLSGL
jgi:4'-phosphopantetheinyl transferase